MKRQNLNFFRKWSTDPHKRTYDPQRDGSPGRGLESRQVVSCCGASMPAAKEGCFPAAEEFLEPGGDNGRRRTPECRLQHKRRQACLHDFRGEKLLGSSSERYRRRQMPGTSTQKMGVEADVRLPSSGGKRAISCHLFSCSICTSQRRQSVEHHVVRGAVQLKSYDIPVRGEGNVCGICNTL